MLLDFSYSSLFEPILGSIKMFYFKSMALEKLFTNIGINKFTNLLLIFTMENIFVLAAINNKAQNTDFFSWKTRFDFYSISHWVQLDWVKNSNIYLGIGRDKTISENKHKKE